jgi:hypothetical protein
MTVIGRDDGTKANQSGWGNDYYGNAWAQPRGGQTLAVSSNKLTVAHVGSSYAVITDGATSYTDADLLVRFVPGASGDSCGLTLRYVDTNNWYYFDVGNLGQKIEIGKDVAGVFTSLTSAAFTWSVGTAYLIRAHAAGTTLTCRAWADGSAEPASWTLSTTDSSLASGKIAISCFPSTTTAIQFDQFVATDTATSSMNSTDNTPITDSLAASLGWTPIDTAAISDTFIAGGTYQPEDDLMLVSSLQGGASATFVESAPISDSATSFNHGYTPNVLLSIVSSLAVAGIFLPADALMALSSLVAMDTFSSVDIAPISDLWSVTSNPYVPPPTPPNRALITLIAPRGKITLQAPRGTITLVGPRGKITLEGD